MRNSRGCLYYGDLGQQEHGSKCSSKMRLVCNTKGDTDGNMKRSYILVASHDEVLSSAKRSAGNCAQPVVDEISETGLSSIKCDRVCIHGHRDKTVKIVS